VNDTDFYSTLGTTFNVGAKGSAQGEVTVLKIGRREHDRAQIRNRVYVRGWDSGGTAIEGVANDAASQAAYGIREIAYFDRLVRSAADLNDVASRKLDELASTTTSCKIHIPVDEGALFHSGDTVTVEEPDFDLSGSYKIYRITKKPDFIELELETIEKTTQDYLGDEFRDLESLGIYTTTPSATTGNTNAQNSDGDTTGGSGTHGHTIGRRNLNNLLTADYTVYYDETYDDIFYDDGSNKYDIAAEAGGDHFHGVTSPNHPHGQNDPGHAHT